MKFEQHLGGDHVTNLDITYFTVKNVKFCITDIPIEFGENRCVYTKTNDVAQNEHSRTMDWQSFKR